MCKRGIWKFDIGEAKNVKLDNGMIYTVNDFMVYKNFRRSWEINNGNVEGGDVVAE
jgi:hypothetical protein